MKDINKSSMCFCFLKSQLVFEELDSSLFLLSGKIHEGAKYVSKLVTCFVLKKVVLYLQNFCIPLCQTLLIRHVFHLDYCSKA